MRRGPAPVREIPIGDTVLSPSSVSEELITYTDVLLGRKQPPVDYGVSTLAELSSAYYARAKEIEMSILRAERDGVVSRGSAFYRLRTGELRSFIELVANAFEMGSRRITISKMEADLT